MNIHTYLKYNNIALIDPQQEYQASCIDQYNQKGYLTPKQLNSLRTWAHSPERIAELIRTEMATVEPIVATPAVEPKRKRFSDEEVLLIINAIEENGSIDKLVKSMPGRTMNTIQSTIARFGGYTRKGYIVGKNSAKLDAICRKYGIVEATSETPFDEEESNAHYRRD